MKITSWNCQGAFRKKNSEILALNSDVTVIQECEHPSRLKFGKLTLQPDSYLWFGTSHSKGVLIFCSNKYRVELVPQYSDNFRYLIPVKIIGDDLEVILFAVWAMDDKKNKHRRYIGQIWEGFNYYKNLLDHPTLAIGDFNSNKIWDAEPRLASHSDMNALLNSKNIFSLYHETKQEEQGKESTPTFFLHRNLNKPYHLDYCYASKQLYTKKLNIRVGDFSSWIDKSDHLPVIVEIEAISYTKSVDVSLTTLIHQIVSTFEGETKIGMRRQIKKLESRIEDFETSKDETLRKKIITYVMQLSEINLKIRSVKDLKY